MPLHDAFRIQIDKLGCNGMLKVLLHNIPTLSTYENIRPMKIGFSLIRELFNIYVLRSSSKTITLKGYQTNPPNSYNLHNI